MAPTKNVTQLPQKVSKKRASRTKPVKPPLKTPTCIKIKIASLGSKPPKIERKITRQRKIELANEVALEQLTNAANPAIVTPTPTIPVTIKTEPESTQQIKKKPALKLKRKLPVKIQEAAETPAKKPAQQSACKPKRSRNTTVKAAGSVGPKSPPKHKAIQSDSEPESWQVILKRPGPKSMTMNLPLSAKTETSVNLNNKTEKTVTKAKSEPGRPRQQKVTDYFSDAIAVTPKIVAKRVTKRKPIRKKPEIEDTKKIAAKQPKGRPRNKFVSERKTGNSTVTRSKGKVLNAKDIKSAAKILDNALKEPAHVQTRSNSVNSTISNLSWTRDISTASSLSETTTCITVCSSDFVRFDKKIPFVQLGKNIEQKALKTLEEHKVDEKKLEDSSSSDSDSESSESSSDSELDDSISKPDLNLSTSSLSKSQSGGTSNNTELLCLEMDKLTNSLKNFYTEMDKWLAFDDDTDTFSTILEAMNLEKDVITSCENFSSIIGNVCAAQQSSPEKHKENSQEVDNLISVSQSQALNETSDPQREKFPVNTSNHTSPNNSPRKSTKSASSETFTSDNCNYVSFDEKICDDEDTLSLYAESITGMESSRLSSVSNMSIQEPNVLPIQRFEARRDTYVVGYEPKPTRPWLRERYSYQPTRIDELPKRMDDVPLKPIEPNMVEKQNADSSSISKDTDLSKKAINLLEDANRLSALAKDSIKSEDQVNKRHRIFSRYQSVNAVKSALYRGHCFFHIATQCKNIISCRFPHDDVNTNVLSCRLVLLTEDSLIEEYLLTVKYKNLRRKFGLLFMKECARRELTRILLEMSIDLGLGVVEREDQNLNVNALETTLLHLNSISFDECEDLLTFDHNNTMLCDALLLRMAYSQNFSQFKRAFVKLTHFMSQIKRPIDIQTVGNILERVCILPCEDSIARGILCLMKNTDARIFENNMTKSFEFQLSSADSDVYDSYLLAKKEAMAVLLDLEQSPTASDQSPISHMGREGPRHPSPDTTNLDSQKKTQMAQPTTFNRTIDTDAIRHLFKSPSNPAPKPRYSGPRQWRRGTGYIQPLIPGLLNNRRIYRNPTIHRNGANT